MVQAALLESDNGQGVGTGDRALERRPAQTACAGVVGPLAMKLEFMGRDQHRIEGCILCESDMDSGKRERRRKEDRVESPCRSSFLRIHAVAEKLHRFLVR